MTNVNYKLWARSFPYVCVNCGNILNRKSEQCEYCGNKELRVSTKKDYKQKFKKVKEL